MGAHHAAHATSEARSVCIGAHRAAFCMDAEARADQEVFVSVPAACTLLEASPAQAHTSHLALFTFVNYFIFMRLLKVLLNLCIGILIICIINLLYGKVLYKLVIIFPC